MSSKYQMMCCFSAKCLQWVEAAGCDGRERKAAGKEWERMGKDRKDGKRQERVGRNEKEQESGGKNLEVIESDRK